MSCSWYLTLTILSVKGSPPAGLPDEKKGKFAWFSHSTESHGNVPLHSVSTLHVCVCLSVYLCADWPINQFCILLHVSAWLCLLLVQCPLHALRITSCSANQSHANVFRIVFHLQISSNMSWKCFTSSSKLTCEISAFWFYSCKAYSGLKNLILNVGFFLIAYLTVSCISEHEFSLFLNLSFQIDKIIKRSVFIKEQAPLEYNIS